MALAEFGIIDRYFAEVGPNLASTLVGIGDDCAVLKSPGQQVLLTTTDTLVENTHFFPGADPEALGYKALAVNLSDLAAMAATPRWVSLALTMPAANQDWLERFARGFSDLAIQYGVQLIGGDTTRGPLTITVHAMGVAHEKKFLKRSTAKPGDHLYISGPLGDAGLALHYLKQSPGSCPPGPLRRLHRPQPRLETGLMVAGLASACIDISDGFVADLGHLLTASKVGATVDWQSIPLSTDMRSYLDQSRDFQLPLCAGDDYELCFTVPANKEAELASKLQSGPDACTKVGIIESRPGLRWRNLGPGIKLDRRGYEHFS